MLTLMAIKPGMMPVAIGTWVTMALVVGVLGAGVYLVVRDTSRGFGKWGINARPLSCPRCGSAASAVRIPKSTRQALWGGFTCGCGCEVDKWGKVIEARPPA